uniref:Uncharacterized protein n=1 Tax=Oryza punctata TaxID=4537 RepID=A0A0E0LKF2_ORYPU
MWSIAARPTTTPQRRDYENDTPTRKLAKERKGGTLDITPRGYNTRRHSRCRPGEPPRLSSGTPTTFACSLPPTSSETTTMAMAARGLHHTTSAPLHRPTSRLIATSYRHP